MTHLCIGAPSNDKAITHAVLLRFGDMRRGELMVKSSQTGVVPHGEMYHNWVYGIGILSIPICFVKLTYFPSTLFGSHYNCTF